MSLIKKLCVGALVVGIVAVAFLAYAMNQRGPTLTAEQHGNTWHIAGRFLGEYSLGFERVKIEAVATRNVVCEFVGHTNADIDLAQGINEPAAMFGRQSNMAAVQSSSTCELHSGDVYEVTVWGNNGSGKVRPSSIRLRL